MRFIDLTGKRFGKLTVIKRVDNYIRKNGRQVVRYLCKCDCGKEKVVNGDALTSGNTTSCGCYNKERIREVHKKCNTYDLSGEYGVGYTYKGERFLFDKEDFDKIKNYCWHISNYGYVVTFINSKKIVLLHRLIMNAPNNLVIDHINHNTIDNRKYNLRVCVQQQNTFNQLSRRDNTSGRIGVVFDKERGKWKAQIGINHKNKYLGRFNNIEQAIEARKQAEKKYFGEFAFQGV